MEYISTFFKENPFKIWTAIFALLSFILGYLNFRREDKYRIEDKREANLEGQLSRLKEELNKIKSNREKLDGGSQEITNSEIQIRGYQERIEHLKTQIEMDSKDPFKYAPDIKKLISNRLKDRIDISKFIGYWTGEAVSFNFPEFNTPTKEILKKKFEREKSKPQEYEEIIGHFSNLNFSIEYAGNNLFKYSGSYIEHDLKTEILKQKNFEGLGYGYGDNINFFYIHNMDGSPDIDDTVSFGSFLFWVEKNNSFGTGLWTIVSSNRNLLTAGKSDVRRISQKPLTNTF